MRMAADFDGHDAVAVRGGQRAYVPPRLQRGPALRDQAVCEHDGRPLAEVGGLERGRHVAERGGFFRRLHARDAAGRGDGVHIDTTHVAPGGKHTTRHGFTLRHEGFDESDHDDEFRPPAHDERAIQVPRGGNGCRTHVSFRRASSHGRPCEDHLGGDEGLARARLGPLLALLQQLPESRFRARGVLRGSRSRIRVARHHGSGRGRQRVGDTNPFRPF
mmetsp:Transcript_29446/g.90966  ORF Transcript_29446/g.90966 Transcript_29446/m.90966 type:complete len:218 (-) Transcript_29446:193-846(-)